MYWIISFVIITYWNPSAGFEKEFRVSIGRMERTAPIENTSRKDHIHSLPPFVDVLPPGPFFDKERSGNLTVLVGHPATLVCRVNRIGNRTVAWLRHRDTHLLTIGRYTYTSDQRFRASHTTGSEDWILNVRYSQKRDSGVYECQISTTPPMRHYIWLSVVQPETVIHSSPDVYINRGSSINLTCSINFSPKPPNEVFWRHNKTVIGLNTYRSGISIITQKGTDTTTNFLIRNATLHDSGKYTCDSDSGSSSSVTVHILTGEHPAAMQHDASGNICYSFYVYIFSFCFIATIK